MVIEDGGNVGIGTSSPTDLLHVHKGSAGASTQPTGNWAAKILNQTDASTEGGLVVANRWADKTSTALLVGGLYDAGDGFDTFLKVDGSGIVTTPNQPSFSCKKTSHLYETQGQTVAGGWTEYHDTGNDFVESTGRFTAPVTGVYFFSICAMTANTSGDAQFRLLKNGSLWIGSNSTEDGASYRQTTVTGTIHLNQNEYVEPATYSSVNNASNIMMYQGTYTTYSGYLIG